ncbi:hypothetical protein G7Y89_g13832 [Cudoniella acicularis]|uniref:Enoyl reductase (ER) domain-containing protein n=1 Tax=Cudoniella acicularis TaxID=354080 RepID=A0A8H4R8R9_9HELO|nr:hypothetical protein G7Y89_g13832 [Cudoniella acicularis]
MSGYDFKVFKGSASGEIVESTTHRPELTGHQVYLELTHSGVCGTDVHFKQADMGLGHEGVGVVRAIGPEVTTLKMQVPFPISPRLTTPTNNITEATEQVGDGCKKAAAPANGSFASGSVQDERFLFKIPDSLPSEAAAPLMCAGITVFAPLTQYGVKSTDVVGVVGIGGLGHLAIQFANKMGCEVVALSGTESKKEEAFKLGAHHFIATKDAKELSVPRKINHLLVTTSFMPDLDQYSSILAPMAQVFPLMVTSFDAKLEVPFMKFLLRGWRFVGCTGAPKIVYQQMLQFAGLHGVRPVIERFPMSKVGVEESMQKLAEGKMRYRGVLFAEEA